MQELNDNKQNSTTEDLKKMNFSSSDEQGKESPIPASDHSRNEERNKRIKEEEDTARLRSESDSVKENE